MGWRENTMLPRRRVDRRGRQGRGQGGCDVPAGQAPRESGELVAGGAAVARGKPQATSCRQQHVDAGPIEAVDQASTPSRSAPPSGVRADWMFQVRS
jgi:hypothetical protein